jgi:hypothetical protein
VVSRCEACEFIGPDEEPLTSDMRALHRAAHDLWRRWEALFLPLVEFLADLRRGTAPGRDDFRLTR